MKDSLPIKKITLGVLGILVIISVITVILIFTNQPQKDSDIYNLNSSIYPALEAISELRDNKMDGYTVIRSENNDFRLTGTFKEGIFIKGNISMTNNNIEYYLNGEFENFNLKNGEMKIITEDKIIYKNGLFVDNKLDGTGSIKIEDKETGEVLFHYAGKFENDMPIY